jgi:hypothetical protein
VAKKSKIAKNERRRETVARYAQRRAELKLVVSNPTASPAEREAAAPDCRSCPVTPAPPGCATGTRWTGALAASSASSGCPGCGCARRRTVANCPA